MPAHDTMNSADETRANGSAAQPDIRDMALKAEQTVRERAQQVQSRARDYYEDAHDRLDTAQRYLVERVQERPIGATLAAIGVGMVLGLLLTGRRR